MTPALFAGFLVFAFVASITPGPNNLMLMASGAQFGLPRTLPHIAGVCLGFGAMTLAVGLGLAGVFRVLPWLYVVLRWAAAAYLLYLAARMATAKGVGQGFTERKPMTFLAAVAFQWVNPKAWVMALGAVTTYARPQRLVQDELEIALIFTLLSVVSSVSWAAFGLGIKRYLRRGWRLRAFNGAMAALLVTSLYPLFTDPLGPQTKGPQSARPAATRASGSPSR